MLTAELDRGFGGRTDDECFCTSSFVYDLFSGETFSALCSEFPGIKKTESSAISLGPKACDGCTIS